MYLKSGMDVQIKPENKADYLQQRVELHAIV